MSNTKTLKGRVINKHKTEEQWYLDVYKVAGGTELREDPFIPYNGELIIYDPDSVYTEQRIKIGNGVDNVVQLPFYQGNPADLLTENKEIVGAINELDDRADALIGDYSKGLSYTLNSDGLSYTVKKGSCTDTEVIIPRMHNGLPVTTIGSAAFWGSSITSVKIPNSVTTIEGMAFNQCPLTSIEIPDSVTSIGISAFTKCPLTSVKIGKSVAKIGGNVFSSCSSLSSIVIPSSVVEIAANAFRDCSALTIYCEAETQPEGWLDPWNSSDCPVVWGCAIDIPSINDAVNELETKSLDKVINIDTWSNSHAENLAIDNQYGIEWNEGYALYDDNNTAISSGTIHHNIPILAGDNVTFTVDEENHVVKIGVPAIGDIQTALDSIIAQTNSIIGGDE